jgi:hypothetical protein
MLTRAIDFDFVWLVVLPASLPQLWRDLLQRVFLGQDAFAIFRQTGPCMRCVQQLTADTIFNAMMK